jgi:hypothetical protein
MDQSGDARRRDANGNTTQQSMKVTPLQHFGLGLFYNPQQEFTAAIAFLVPGSRTLREQFT